jgi:hypothetical protein
LELDGLEYRKLLKLTKNVILSDVVAVGTTNFTILNCQL